MDVKKIILLFTFFLLVGCKATVETEVKLSELLTGGTKEISGDLYMEVPACNSYQDSRLDSSAIQEIKQKVPDVFSGAEYVECFSKQFKSYAHFELPIVIDKGEERINAVDSALKLSSTKKVLMSFSIPSRAQNKLADYERGSMFTQPLDLAVEIKVTNDLGKDYPFNVISAYVDEEPYVYGKLTVKANQSVDISLSNVSVGQARSAGTALVLMY